MSIIIVITFHLLSFDCCLCNSVYKNRPFIGSIRVSICSVSLEKAAVLYVEHLGNALILCHSPCSACSDASAQAQTCQIRPIHLFPQSCTRWTNCIFGDKSEKCWAADVSRVHFVNVFMNEIDFALSLGITCGKSTSVSSRWRQIKPPGGWGSANQVSLA